MNETINFFILIFRYQDEKEELEHDVSNAIDKIERWKAHILRAVLVQAFYREKSVNPPLIAKEGFSTVFGPDPV